MTSRREREAAKNLPVARGGGELPSVTYGIPVIGLNVGFQVDFGKRK